MDTFAMYNILTISIRPLPAENSAFPARNRVVAAFEIKAYHALYYATLKPMKIKELHKGFIRDLKDLYVTYL